MNILGALHVHSDFSSDGKISLDEIKKLFLKRGVRFVCLTEHIEDLTALKYGVLVKNCASLSDDGFLFVPGIEIEDKCLLIIGIYAINDFEKLKKRDFSNINKYFTVLAHPHKLKESVLRSLLEGGERYSVDAMEIVNIRYNGRHMGVPLYVIKNYIAYQDRIKAILGIDLHDTSDLFDAYIKLDCNSLSATEILSGLKKGNYELIFSGKTFSIPKGNLIFFYIKIVLSRSLISVANFINMVLKKAGFPVPKNIKQRIKKLL
jgi:hypothetical protein